MNKKFLILVAVFVVFGTVLVFQAKRVGSSLVLTPSQVASAEVPERRRVRVAGKVSDKGYDYETEPRLLLRFHLIDIEEPGSELEVVYSDLKPDMFGAGSDVIVNGFIRDGKLVASSLQTQCPSKYEPPSPEKYMEEAAAKEEALS